jgi:putative oxygen-independent coproporphyrinogen III oxidase
MGAQTNAFGIYVHVPYCRRICPYCDFNVYIAKRADWDALTCGIEAELAARGQAFTGLPAQSVYFGGGTPSLAPASLLSRTLTAIVGQRQLVADAEITVEVDPATLDSAGYAQLRQLGVTRVSVGWQSSHDVFLKRLGRGHSAADSEQAYAWARAAGCDNISIDLIFAVPGETMAHLEADLDTIARLGADHVSLYALTYHEGTEFERRRRAGRLQPIDENLEADMMAFIETRLGSLGYEHYEVSNYARSGKRSRHNQIYWHGGQYLGVGPGAHSFARQAWQRGWRWESVRAPATYVDLWSPAHRHERMPGLPTAVDATVSFVEELDAAALRRERFLLGLRLGDGIDVAEVDLGADESRVAQAAAQAEARGWVTRVDTSLRPTSLGLMHADSLAMLFF